MTTMNVPAPIAMAIRGGLAAGARGQDTGSITARGDHALRQRDRGPLTPDFLRRHDAFDAGCP